jgi:RNA polymerase sigma-54 factor
MAVDGVVLAFEQVARMEMNTVPLLAFSAELLALDASQLDERIQHELSSNPALRVTRRCSVCGAWAPATICQACRRPRPATPPESGGRSARSELLVEALAVAPQAARRAVEAVIASLDQHGLLTRTSPDEIQFLARCTASELDQALRAVREVGPAGLACFDARSCLLAQIDELSQESSQPGEWVLARRIVDRHLAALAAGDVPALAAALPADVAEVQSAGALIRRRLTPYPDIDLTDDHPGPSAPPDIVFRRTSDGLEVEVNDPWRGGLMVSAEFDLAATKATDREVRHFMKEQLQRARLLVAALDRRRATIHRVASAVAAHHHDALVAGSQVYGQLRRRDVATALDLHESTVSRAVRDRTAELPDGRVVPLATMFGSGHEVRAALARLLATEEKCSDQRLSEMLRAQGIPTARRTVAKYRKQMEMAAC